MANTKFQLTLYLIYLHIFLAGQRSVLKDIFSVMSSGQENQATNGETQKLCSPVQPLQLYDLKQAHSKGIIALSFACIVIKSVLN